NAGLHNPYVIQYGQSPHDLLTISHDKAGHVITIFHVQLPTVEASEKPQWVLAFKTLVTQACTRLNEDYARTWGLLFTGKTMNLYDLLKDTFFKKLFTQLTVEE